MTKNGTSSTSVKKCTVHWGRSLQRYLANREDRKVSEVRGIHFALEYIQAMTWMCLSGMDYGVGENDIPNMPHGVRPLYKNFLCGYAENNSIMRSIASSTRVEFHIDWSGNSEIMVAAIFFKKAKEILGTERAHFELYTGRCRGRSAMY